ncbi:MAG: 16S rRNA (guanine(527)-N(7))-methyltransferase RsmG [Synechococcales bacterium]|nr:16S rRNA (guanine(527)-N(7))-methyltransferase RsmG [Synechococcales bacterium]
MDQSAESVLPAYPEQWQALGWQPTPEQQQQLNGLYRLIVLGNQQLNLTRITDPQEFWEKHLWDSLRGIEPAGLRATARHLPLFQPQLRLIDIGTGAGFPGVPIAIARPQWQVTLLDSTRKKITFLTQTTSALNLHNTLGYVDRVEQMGHDANHRQQYDVATIRAVAGATVCAEYALPLVKVGGIVILYRGQWMAEEAIALEEAVWQLGGEILLTDRFTTPLSQGIRTCLYLRKLAPTPERFPRAIGIPTQKPL